MTDYYRQGNCPFWGSTLYKRITKSMINPFTGINEEIDIHQRRVRLTDPTDPKTRAISSLIIYCSFYYPHTKSTLLEAVLSLRKEHLPSLQAAITHLFHCLQREIITGPSSSYLPPAEVPETHHEDILLRLNPVDDAGVELLWQGIVEIGLEKLIAHKEARELSWYNCNKLLSMKAAQQLRQGYSLYHSELDLEGESWLQTMPFPSLFLTINHLLRELINTELPINAEMELRRLLARLAFLHNRSLKNPVKSLCETVLGNYRAILGSVEGWSREVEGWSREDYIELLLEYSFSLLFYYKYSQAEAVLRHCCRILAMKIEFTGKMGRRTKYQSFDVPQLVMDIGQQQGQQVYQNEEEQEDGDGDGAKKIDFVDAKLLVAREKSKGSSAQEGQLKPAAYDEESILLQTPKFSEQCQRQQNKSQVSEHHLLVTLAILHFQWRSSPHDEILYQNISSSIATMLKYQIPTSFSYNHALLLLRSLNEFPRIKHAERALEQLQKLRLVFNGRAGKSAQTLFATPYEPHLGHMLVLADRYMQVGLSLSAIELFAQAGLQEQCIDVLIQKNYKEKALEMLTRLMQQKQKNARMLCMLADIHKEPKFYWQAWQLSKGRSSRAMRALGWHYFSKQDFSQAAQCFQKATAVSYYHPSTWFTLGCCYMRDKNFDKALKAFSECVSIDDSQGEAWGNMASCYMHQKKMKEAYSTLQQAVKYSEGSWKLWSNLIAVSLVVRKFYKYFEAIEKVAKLGHQELLTQEMFRKVVQVMAFKNQSDDRRRILFNFRSRINRLFDSLEQMIGQNPLVWRGRSLFQIQILEYIDVMSVHYHNLHVTHTVDPNDLVPGYETLASTQATSERETRETRARIVGFKQAELNMAMRIGWHDNRIQCEKVKSVLLEYVDIYRQFSSREEKEDFKLFIGGISQKISHCLQSAFEIPLLWL